jgi:hypothetical protein
MKRGLWSPEDIETLRAMAAAGVSRTLIALRLRRSLHGVKSVAREHGIQLASKRARPAGSQGGLVEGPLSSRKDSGIPS